jgi:two-component system nitrogen regulation response regulator GlnG
LTRAEGSEAIAHDSWQQQLESWVSNKLQAGEQKILLEAMPEFERIVIRSALRFTAGKRQEAAKLLGWGRNTLTRKINELEMDDLK